MAKSRKSLLRKVCIIFSGMFLAHAFFTATEINAGMKLKKAHKTVKQTCRSCHHKPQKKCSNCHMKNITTKISSFKALPPMVKKLHEKCSSCHSIKGVVSTSRISKYIRSDSKCKICH